MYYFFNSLKCLGLKRQGEFDTTSNRKCCSVKKIKNKKIS